MKKTAVIASAAALTGVFASAAVANADTVTVKSGDTVSKLAKDYNTTVDAIVNTNKLSNANLIFVGQKLEIGEATQADNNQQAAQGQQSQQSQQVTPAASSQQATTNYNTTSNYTSNVSGDEQAAKEWIAARESGGSYTAQNGRYYGRYQLDASYLGGDFSPANQDRVADQYVASRYGSWSAAKSYWLSNGWY
ncbi:LysM peptidoglycan-binding domain-containing protein [Lactobacillus salivarius]|uniref:LysM peptidoglycan-binding domain-containing protein n=1 Tax=Ligilactobacillus salivarius TaxID=1624 RepID=A0ABD6J4I8_9LACO|nr:LysM peptidoglycan-binding domain-containing protein [Ligilactobacillus salivarius]HBU67965.1 LysM peptidoglycan-binding domain-containing protein [Lactobacillus sp.]MBM6708035.1 LysM peptidoglycan-binding domain-containing protein [Ligilactobacillus salivarius]MDE1498547.1 LysM peptidoglycan-binding domain-containing protein [Ligilactobacillus salivarius]MDE1500379.1 LysM peptidoglycan-binding domain-containing protein [Ligilactobacillus salivarius]MDE1523844.1 LysM peptidoglycan-binding d